MAFNGGPFDDPDRGRQDLNVFPFSGDFDRDSPFQALFAAVVYLKQWQPYTQNWNLTAQRALGAWLMQAGYVGAKSTHLLGNTELSAPIYNPLTLAQNQAAIQQRRPLSDFQSITALFNGLDSATIRSRRPLTSALREASACRPPTRSPGANEGRVHAAATSRKGRQALAEAARQRQTSSCVDLLSILLLVPADTNWGRCELMRPCPAPCPAATSRRPLVCPLALPRCDRPAERRLAVERL